LNALFIYLADTVKARDYTGTNYANGWMGLRFQLQPGGPPCELLHKRPVVLAPGYFGHVDLANAQIHSQITAAAIQDLRKELGEALGWPRSDASDLKSLPKIQREMGYLL
jgi:hypothetical protein